MAYHPLANDTGGDDFARNREAHKIIVELGLGDLVASMSITEARFVEQSQERLEEYGMKARFSAKQIFWLRDLADKYGAF